MEQVFKDCSFQKKVKNKKNKEAKFKLYFPKKVKFKSKYFLCSHSKSKINSQNINSKNIFLTKNPSTSSAHSYSSAADSAQVKNQAQTQIFA